MKITCSSCGQPVAGVDIDLAGRIAVCRRCGEVMPLPEVGARSNLAPPAPPAPPLGDDYQPSDLALRESREDRAILLQHAPTRLASVPLLAFALVWDSFLVFWYSMAFTAGGGPAGIMLWFPLLHLGAGVAITYQALCGLINSASFRLDHDRFTFRHGPLPRLGAIDEPLSNVQGFVAADQSSRKRAGWGLRLLTRDGRSVPIKLDLKSPEHAHFLAARLDRALAELREPKTYRG